MSKAREPTKVFEDLQAIRMALPAILAEYRRAHDFAYSAGGGAGGESGRSGQIDESNPTRDIALSGMKNHARSRVRHAGEAIADALGKLNEANADLHKAFPKDPDVYEEVVRLPPRAAYDSDIAEAREAQQRRAGRGDL